MIENSEQESETSRLEAFSDGTFAVAITLLVLNIKIPGLDLSPDKLSDDPTLWKTLANEWPMAFAYATSFLTVGIMWLNHHRLFVHIKRIDTTLLFINLLLLMTIVFIPVPTALLAEYILLPDHHTAMILYSGVCLIMAIVFNLLWRYASHQNRLLGKNVDMDAVDAISKQYLFGPLLYMITFGLAWISPPASVILTFILAIFFALPSRTARSIATRKASRSPSAAAIEPEPIEEMEL